MTHAHKPVIVYVEDNSGDALLLREALLDREHDAELLIIENGEKAMHYFQIKAEAADLPPPHCILLDARLPMVTGIELIKFIRSSDAFDRTPVFIFASPRDYEDVSAKVDISPDSFLKKPSGWEQFKLLADTLMRGAKISEEESVDEPEAAAQPHPELRQINSRP